MDEWGRNEYTRGSVGVGNVGEQDFGRVTRRDDSEERLLNGPWKTKVVDERDCA